ncbi:AI-2E family transporter [Cellulomonas marina]|uniref:Predicted PurR-regulated permease PerM n=1 Tax=Cellulomonas marina TaxID=988821 RepID=A0A1I0ZU55_9CELL|nr:AI-2E family transporter [Cellulomonas marina]GIG28836.1 AI-2E family transporter [Cellulomonas marina]SFB27858.1 Predicted PurR-regulated permease PerM [Cellulomonas marina]
MSDSTGTGAGPRTTVAGRPVVRRVAGHRPRPVPAPGAPAPQWLQVLAAVSWRLLVVVAAVSLVFYATAQVQLLFVALFLALVFTAVLRPLVDLLDRVMPRGIATAIGLLAGFAFFAGLVAYVAYSVADQWSALQRQFGQGIEQITDYLEGGSLPFVIDRDQIAEWVANAQVWVQEHSGELASQAAERAGSVVEIFTGLALAIFCAVFFLARGTSMWTWFLNQLPARVRGTWQEAADAGWSTFSGYTRGIVFVALSDGLLALVFLSALQVPLAAPLAVLVFVGAFIPLIGAPLAMVVAMIVALAANGFWAAVVVGLGIAGIGQIEGHVLQPLIMGKQVSLHPVMVAVAVTAGTLTAGILGAVVAVPLVSVAWAIFSRLRTVDPPLPDEDEDPLVEHVGERGDGVPDEEGAAPARV